MLEMRNIPIGNMRGQGFDNEATIKRKKNRLQNMFLQVNPHAFIVPYFAHRLNFIIKDASKVNSDTISFLLLPPPPLPL